MTKGLVWLDSKPSFLNGRSTHPNAARVIARRKGYRPALDEINQMPISEESEYSGCVFPKESYVNEPLWPDAAAPGNSNIAGPIYEEEWVYQLQDEFEAEALLLKRKTNKRVNSRYNQRRKRSRPGWDVIRLKNSPSVKLEALTEPCEECLQRLCAVCASAVTGKNKAPARPKTKPCFCFSFVLPFIPCERCANALRVRIDAVTRVKNRALIRGLRKLNKRKGQYSARAIQEFKGGLIAPNDPCLASGQENFEP